MSVITDPAALLPPSRPCTPDFASLLSPSTTPSPSPSPAAFQPHRRLYNHRVNSPAPTAASAVTFSSQPLMLVPRARVRDDNDDLLRRRMYAVVPDNSGLETLQISAISGASGWVDGRGEDEDGGGWRRGGGLHGGEGGGRRPLTAFDYNARRRRRGIQDSRSGGSESSAEIEDTKPTAVHPLLTRRGKMTLLLGHRPKRHRITASDRSVSADSGLGSPSPSAAELNDKTSHDVISVSDVFDDVTQFSGATGAAESVPLLPQISGHHTRRSPSSVTGGGRPGAGGLFGSYMSRHSLAGGDFGYEFHGKTFRGAADDDPPAAIRTPPNSDDADAAEEDAVFVTPEPGQAAPPVSRVPEHLDSFSQVAEAIVGQLRQKQKRQKKRSRGQASVGGELDDAFDDRWHSGRHEDGDDCPMCREFARTTRRQVDRVFGGTESFLSWIFSKWGKRKDLEGAYRRKIGVRGRSPHFCNFVHKASVHTRPDSAQAHTGSDDDDGIGSMSEATDQDILAQWRKQSRLTGSGTEGRPGSPTSMNGRHGAKGDNDLTGRNSGSEDDTMNVSVIVNHMVNSEGESVARRDSKDDMADDVKKRPVPHRRTSSIGSVRKRPVKTRATSPNPIAKMIPTITIPSSPIPPADQSMSNRSSADQSSPRKSAREEPRPRASSARRSAERPPSASRQPPKEPQVPEPSKRPPVPRKTKKNTARRRKSKSVTMDVPASAERSAEGDSSQGPAEGASRTTPEGLDVNAKIPDLPGLPPSGKDHGRKSRRSGRRLISPAQETGEKQKTPNDLLDPDTSIRAGYDFGDMETTVSDSYNNKLRLQSWLNNRMALSQRASRFELPMDMKVLESMTPQDYLKKFCIVSSRRVNLYQKIFVKHKDKTSLLSKQVLETCLKETLVQTLKPETFGDVCELLEITDSTVIDFKLFSGIAAITERILYPCYLTEDTVEKPEYQREQIEAADFEALDWKLHGIQVSPHMRKLLKLIE